MSKDVIPQQILEQHLAVVGKTGSGKTSTAKLAIEQVVGAGARVCILDPIKSDWWGLTSSASGKSAGLPFHILGGPHGHVPLHESAGKAIGEIVATGGLPLSIIDMADFAPGGQSQFFADFAPALLRKMRGVLYLVIEEAHLFAPKERSGIGKENMSIHWAKTLATAGRSKGIRLIPVTQRTQALHNAILGSCDTLIAHRLTAPADQEPINKWLKANVEPSIAAEVAASLSSMKTGEGWICAGEAKIFERRQFPRIKTYDNTATPTGDGANQAVKTAVVDREKLTAIIGDAVKEAVANDPKELKKTIATLQKDLAAAKNVKPPAAEVKRLEVPVITDKQVKNVGNIVTQMEKEGARRIEMAEKLIGASRELKESGLHLAGTAKEFSAALARAAYPGNLPTPATRVASLTARGSKITVESSATAASARPSRAAIVDDPSGVVIDKCAKKILAVLSQFPEGCDSGKLTLLTGYRYSGGFKNSLSTLRSAGFIEGNNTDTMTITQAGLDQGPFPALPTGKKFVNYWLGHSTFDKCAKAILKVLVDHPDGLTADEIRVRTDPPYEYSGGFKNALSDLRTAGVLVGKNTATMSASTELLEARRQAKESNEPDEELAEA